MANQVIKTSLEQPATPQHLERNANAETFKHHPSPETNVQKASHEKPEQEAPREDPMENAAKPENNHPQSNSPNKRLRYGPSQRNKSGRRAKNGSYRNYYERRNNGIHGDDRLPIIRQAISFQGKAIKILDVGCNDGTVTIAMASMQRCIEAVGIDIDPNLVGAARKKLREHVRREEGKTEAQCANPNIQGAIPKSDDSLPLSLRRSLHLMKHAKEKGKQEGTSIGTTPTSTNFPYNCTFRREDVAQKAPTVTSQQVEKYNVVLCLSVTKWVHLAGGDDALKRMFRRLHTCLKPGGVLILEPQPQKSYKSAIRKGLGKKDLRGERKLKPHRFVEYLIRTVGFTKMNVLRDTGPRGQAFSRPIMAFYKKQETPGTQLAAAHSQHALRILGILPSNNQGGEGQQPGQPNASEAQDEPEQHDAAGQNGMVAENVGGNESEEVEEGGEKDDEDGVQVDERDERVSGQETQEKGGREDAKQPEATPEEASVGPNQADGDASVTHAGEHEVQPAEGTKAPSSQLPNREDAVLPASGSKRKSSDQNVEGCKPQSPKRSKQDQEDNQSDTSSPSGGS